MTDQTSTTSPDPIALPGRIVDLVYAALHRLDLTLHSLSTVFGSGQPRHITVIAGTTPTRSTLDEGTARAVFALLGVSDSVLSPRYGQPEQAALTGQVPLLAAHLRIVVTQLPPLLTDHDVQALVTQVDATRAAHPAPALPAMAVPDPASRPETGQACERAARFEARFDSVCPACRQVLPEGAPASWLDGEAVHDHCTTAAGVQVYDR